MNYSSSVLLVLNFVYILSSYIDVVEGIRGGSAVEAGQFMYHVSVLINGQHGCGGAIIDYKHVLTAASCVLDEDGHFLNVRFDILAGVNYLDSNSFSKVKRKVVYVRVLHKFRIPGRVQLYPRSLEDGDIAVLQVDEPFPLGANSVLKSALIPRRGRNGKYQKYQFQLANLSGFGENQPKNYQSASNINNLLLRRNAYKTLSYTQVGVQRKDLCKHTYPRMKDDHICALSIPVGNNPTGACLGDIGGPLVNEDYSIIGVLTVYNNECDDSSTPALYTRVSSYVEFIDASVRGIFNYDMRLADYSGSSVNEIVHPTRRI